MVAWSACCHSVFRQELGTSQNGKLDGNTAVVTGIVDGVSTTVEDAAQTAFEPAPRTGQSFVVSRGSYRQ